MFASEKVNHKFAMCSCLRKSQVIKPFIQSAVNLQTTFSHKVPRFFTFLALVFRLSTPGHVRWPNATGS